MNWVEWFYRPKVQFGVWVNLVFILFLIMSPTAGVSRRARVEVAYSPYAAQPAPSVIPYGAVPPRPPAAPNKVSVVNSEGRVSVTLDRDLTLVSRPDRTLQFAPSIVFSTSPDPTPARAVLTFTIAFRGAREACPNSCMLLVTADRQRVVESFAKGALSSDWTHRSVPGTSAMTDDGQVVETLPVETFSTQIDFQKFVALVRANRVVVSFGPDSVDLTRDQIESLREMYREVSLPQEPMPWDAMPKAAGAPKVVKAF